MISAEEQNTISECRLELFGIAALLVTLVHSSAYNWEMYPAVLLKICKMGSIGVDIFLFLSGMGLYYSMQKCGSVRLFYRHRIIRIMPSYLTIAVVLYGVSWLIHNISLTNYFLYISTLYFWIYGESEIGAWYISFVLLLYLVFPAIYKILNGKKWAGNISILIGITIIAEICLLNLAPGFYIKYEIALSRIPIFLIGTIFGKREFGNKGYFIWSIPVFGIGFIAIRILLICFGNPQTDLYNTIVRLSYIPGTLFIVEFLPFLRNLSKGIPDNPVRRALELLGSVSLEIYLVHLIYSGIFRSLRIYQTYNTPIAYFIFVVLPSIAIVILVKYTLQRMKARNQK